MPAASSFRRIQPVSLFKTTWEAKGLVSLKNKPGVGDVTREVALPPSNPSMFFGARGRSVKVDRDIWGADWSAVPNEDWNDDLPEEVFAFPTAYLEFQLTVSGGIPGDSILFAYNAPTHSLDSGIHSYAQLQVPSFGGSDSSVNTSPVRSISRDLVEGFAYAQDEDNPMEVLMSDTKISLYGVGKTDEISISAECMFLGGFADEQ
jgi:hypothetical protein